MIRDGYKDYMNGVQKTRQQWILNHKSQIVSTGNQIIWCTITQDAIK
jgi:dynein heavy chain